MGVGEWLTNVLWGGSYSGWSALPAVAAAPIPERKAAWTIDDIRAAFTVNTLIHGPGATEILEGRRDDNNSAVFACLQAIATAVPEAPLRVYRVRGDQRELVADHPLQTLLDRPNPHLAAETVLAWVSWALHVDGNAYLRKLRSGDGTRGNVVELWPISPRAIEIRSEGGAFVSAYRYHYAAGRHEDIPPENMVHFRLGLDDRDHRKGLSPLKRLVRHTSSDDEASRFANRLLSNFAVPGLVVQVPADTRLSTEDAEALKARVAAAYGGDSRGAVGVLTGGATMQPLGFSPEQMDLKVLHRLPEERIAAVLGVPAIVAGLGAGLDRATYANFKEAREAFTETKLVPLWRSLSSTLTMSLVPDFARGQDLRVEFDLGDVRALQDDENAKATRLQVYVASGILTRDEARSEIGREPLPEAPPPPAPAEQRSRPPLRILGRKGIEDIPGRLDGLKDDAEPAWQEALATYLDQLAARIARRLASSQSADLLVPDTEVETLAGVLEPRQLALLEDVHRLVLGELGIAFDVDDPLTRQYLADAGVNIRGITGTTREAVRAALIAGQAEGEDIEQLARRLRQLAEFGRSRAITIARTELGHAANTAALANYRASGVVVGVTVLDGDYDAACAAMNGRKFPLDQAPPTLQHPRCRRAFAPIVDAAELEASA